MGFDRSTITDFSAETHPHPNLPLEGEGVLNVFMVKTKHQHLGSVQADNKQMPVKAILKCRALLLIRCSKALQIFIGV